MPPQYAAELRSLPDQIADALRDSIVSGELSADERLPTESELADEFGVSRPTVREALKRLAAKNLIRSQRGVAGGNFVSVPSEDQVRSDLGTTAKLLVSHEVFSVAEVAESRRVLEAACVRLAAERRTDDQLAELRDLAELQNRPDLSDEEFCDTDVAFHRVVVAAAGNTMLDYSMAFALEALHPSTNLVINRFRRRADVVDLQRRLLDALVASDAEAAEAAVHAQVDHFLAVFAEAQHWVENRRAEREQSGERRDD